MRNQLKSVSKQEDFRFTIEKIRIFAKQGATIDRI
jgi:hypothetical protein